MAYGWRVFWTYSSISEYFTNKTEATDRKAHDITSSVINIFSTEVMEERKAHSLFGKWELHLGLGDLRGKLDLSILALHVHYIDIASQARTVFW